MSGCTQSGQIASANPCSVLGQSLPFTLTLSQSSRNVSGSFTLGTIAIPNTGGTVATDGSLLLNGTFTDANGATLVVTWTLANNGTALSGLLTEIVTVNGFTGNVTFVGTITRATR